MKGTKIAEAVEEGIHSSGAPLDLNSSFNDLNSGNDAPSRGNDGDPSIGVDNNLSDTTLGGDGRAVEVEVVAPIGDEWRNDVISVSAAAIASSTVAVEEAAMQLPVMVEKVTTTNSPVEEVAMSYTNQAAAVTCGYVKKREIRKPPPCLVFNGGAFATAMTMNGLAEKAAIRDGRRRPWLRWLL